MNSIRSFSSILLPVIALAFAPPISRGAEMPHAIQTLIDKRKDAIRKIDKIYIQELEKVKTAYTKAGDLEKANLAAELIKNASGSEPDQAFSLDGEWKYKMDEKDVTVVRKFKGNKMIDEGGIQRSWVMENGSITISYGPGLFEKFILDPRNPDEIKGTTQLGKKFTYTRIK